jgi:transposase
VLSIPPTTKLWYGGAVDLRLGFDGLYRHVQSTLQVSFPGLWSYF